ncbi:hypothetical protein KSP40_PGU021512 [Platanthera guangdongensis]|uniref:Uncharacterized protein n=1 Tax=Platanthera guangdongensis TaxID=2320717 RepID=A0ABR2MFS5_9ASPA
MVTAVLCCFAHLISKFVLLKRIGEWMSLEENSWESLAEFQNLTYWNHDSLPAKHDLIMRSFHWFADAVIGKLGHVSKGLRGQLFMEQLASLHVSGINNGGACKIKPKVASSQVKKHEVL